MPSPHANPAPDRIAPLLQSIARAMIETSDRRLQVRLALDGLIAAVSSTCAALTRLSLEPQGPQIIDVLEAGVWTTVARNAYMEYLRDPSATDPFYAAVIAEWRIHERDGATLSGRRRDFLDDRAWYDSNHYRKYRSRAGHDDCIYALIRPSADRPWATGLSLHRGVGDPPFDPADRALAHAWLAGLVPLITQLDPDRAGAATLLSSLTPRQRDVLLRYAHGSSAKQAAKELGLSVASVQTYGKQAFRKLGVSGRAEAVALCISRGWLLEPAPHADTNVDDQSSGAKSGARSARQTRRPPIAPRRPTTRKPLN